MFDCICRVLERRSLCWIYLVLYDSVCYNKLTIPYAYSNMSRHGIEMQSWWHFRDESLCCNLINMVTFGRINKSKQSCSYQCYAHIDDCDWITVTCSCAELLQIRLAGGVLETLSLIIKTTFHKTGKHYYYVVSTCCSDFSSLTMLRTDRSFPLLWQGILPAFSYKIQKTVKRCK